MTNDLGSFSRRRLVVASATLLLASGACADASGPFDPLPPEVTAPKAEVEAFNPSISDASGRVLPVILDPIVERTLADDLSRLESALNQGDARGARVRVRSAQGLLDRYRTRPETKGDAPDLSVIELVLDRARRLLGMEEAS